MNRRFRATSFWPWLAAALALHGLTTLLLRARQQIPEAPSIAHRNVTEQKLEIELLNEPSLRKLKQAASPNLEQSASLRAEPGLEAAPRRPKSAPTRLTADYKSPAATETGEQVAEGVGLGGVEPTPAAPHAESTPAAAPPKVPRSLAELGYGAPHAAAIQPYLNSDPVANAQNRLDQNLAQAIVDRDRNRSNGIEGPLTHAIHTAAMGVVVPTSLSKVAIVIGSNGKLADIQIISTNQDARALANLSARLKHLLANQAIRVPSGRAMEFTYEIKSEVQFPSGRAPGLGVEVLGIPLREGRSEKSSKVSILTPKVKFGSVSEPDPERNGKVTQSLPQLSVGISVLGVDADLVDLGANERQVVHTRLIQQRVL